MLCGHTWIRRPFVALTFSVIAHFKCHSRWFHGTAVDFRSTYCEPPSNFIMVQTQKTDVKENTNKVTEMLIHTGLIISLDLSVWLNMVGNMWQSLSVTTYRHLGLRLQPYYTLLGVSAGNTSPVQIVGYSQWFECLFTNFHQQNHPCLQSWWIQIEHNVRGA